MPELIRHADGLEVRSRLGRGLRVVFLLLAGLPLLAPYELLLQPR